MTEQEQPPLCAAHDPAPRSPNIEIPAGSCDCHAHVFGPGSTYPFIPQGLYTPGDLLNLFVRWVPDEKLRGRILVSNPASLYDFPSDGSDRGR
jgi:predicted TIM-barrel fold metal-dependent hydrolase